MDNGTPTGTGYPAEQKRRQGLARTCFGRFARAYAAKHQVSLVDWHQLDADTRTMWIEAVRELDAELERLRALGQEAELAIDARNEARLQVDRMTDDIYRVAVSATKLEAIITALVPLAGVDPRLVQGLADLQAALSGPLAMSRVEAVPEGDAHGAKAPGGSAE